MKKLWFITKQKIYNNVEYTKIKLKGIRDNLNENYIQYIIIFILSFISLFTLFYSYQKLHTILSSPVLFYLKIIFVFYIFLHIRASLPRYKLADLQTLYWKHILIYTLVIQVIYSVWVC